MESKKRVWSLLGKSSAADELSAFAALRDARDRHQVCVQRQQKLLTMRDDYEKRLMQAGSRIQGGRDIEICRNFILHIEGLQSLLQQQIGVLLRAIAAAERRYDLARLNTAKWSHLEDRDAELQRRRRTMSEQKLVDENAAVRFARRIGR